MVSKYGTTLFPTPVFNTPDVSDCFGGQEGNNLLLDEQGLLRAVETVLFPNTCVQLLENIANSSMWRIKTEEYPHGENYFIDQRFVSVKDSEHFRPIELPCANDILTTMKSLNKKTSYIWGGNWPLGVKQLPEFYPSKVRFAELPAHVQNKWQLKGVDCSGLLYYATNGKTPRNTSGLVRYGHAVEIQGLDSEKIVEKLKPLDLVAWVGHVVCVLDQNTFIESKNPEGVVTSDAVERLSEIMEKRKPVDDWAATNEPRFVVRRWHPETL